MSSEKKLAARAAIEYVHDGMILGLGTGTTASYALQFLGERVRQGLNVQGIPTSETTRQLALREQIPLTDFSRSSRIDLCIDGTDEINDNLDMIKGGGGALLREKIVASCSDFYIIIADSSKKVNQLGTFPLPVEVVSFGWQVVFDQLEELKFSPVLRIQDESPFLTDDGNCIIDCNMGRIDDPLDLETKLNRIPGIVENGLFAGMCDLLILGEGDDVLQKKRS